VKMMTTMMTTSSLTELLRMSCQIIEHVLRYFIRSIKAYSTFVKYSHNVCHYKGFELFKLLFIISEYMRYDPFLGLNATG
jgi:hypothetical protein